MKANEANDDVIPGDPKVHAWLWLFVRAEYKSHASTRVNKRSDCLPAVQRVVVRLAAFNDQVW